MLNSFDAGKLKPGQPNNLRHIYIGNHGGVSHEEMFVPLIVIK